MASWLDELRVAGAGDQVSVLGGDLGLHLGGGAVQGGDPLAEVDQGLVQDPGLPVSISWAGQRRALLGSPFAGEVAEAFAYRCSPKLSKIVWP